MTLDMSPAQEDHAAALIAVVAEPVRWRILNRLAASGMQCVCDLLPVGGVAPNVLSYHLKVLREAGLVTATKRGRWVDYALTSDAHERITAALPTSVTVQDPQTAEC